MEYKKIEDVLENKTQNYDSKHILNLAPDKKIPDWVFDRLQSEGLTIEKIDELQDKGFPVCHYETQITIHGVCDSLPFRRTTNGYVTLCKNKNNSLGVRWIAVDEEKRRRIYSYLRHYGWSHQHNSSCDYYWKVLHLTEESVKMLKEQEKRIDKTSFFGRTSLYTASLYGMRYIILECHVSGIYEANIKRFVESMTGETFDCVFNRNQEYCAQKKAEWERRDRELKERDEANRLKREEWKRTHPMPQGFVEIDGTDLKVGDIICELKEFTDTCYWLLTLVYKAGNNLCKKLCDENGVPKERRGTAIKNFKKKYFVKRLQPQKKENIKPMQKTAETAQNKPSKVEISDYKNAILVHGDTKPIKDKLKAIDGSWNSKLGGWIFPKGKRKQVMEIIGQ